MSRWEPDAAGRLQRAAMELFAEHGYDRTTTAQIAERAGVTERTFFRHFTDKREVLFDGSGTFEATVLDGVRAAGGDLGPVDVVGAAFVHLAETMFAERHAHAVARNAIISTHPDLQERELIKMSRLGTLVTEALHERRVPEPAASLAAQSGVAVFRVSFARWVGQDGTSLADLLRQSLAELKSLTR
ncbi:TetR/AcrR family transcriptional regulator [Spongisporangium articulatum]|uniref:TetR/AcrR family transcriptional regulator n=1 Tax=Spongisporangium articulatum TaxID=3362603 RepID=A0ABW8AN98_9ACTN